MAVEKILNTKIRLLTRTYEEWTTTHAADILLKGEIGICEIPANGIATTAPTVLFKVGDGELPYYTEDPATCLKWASALAADVYAWAKQANLPIERADGKNEDGTDKVAGNVISGIYWDEAGKIKYTTASVATSEGMAELQETVAGIAKDIADNRDAWTLDTDTRYSFSTDGEKLVVKKTLYTNGVAGTEEAVGTYEFLTANEVAETLKDYYTKTDLEGKIHTEDEIKAMEVEHATAAGKVDKALTVKVGGVDVEFDGSEAKTADVDAAISDAIAAAAVDYTVTVTPRDDEKGDDHTAFKHYVFTQCNKEIAHIDIPKDLVVEEGHVREVTEADKPYTGAVVGEKYIELVIANQEEHLYIPAKDLVEYISVDDTDTIDLTLTADHVLTADLKDNAVTTAKIADKNVTEAKLDEDVQNALSLARTALQSHQDISGKADKVTDAVAGNFAGLDENGNLVDSGKKADDFATKEQGEKADTALQNVEVGTGLKVANKMVGEGEEAVEDATCKVIDIDTDVVFILNCNY